jgi:Protein of unknown function (DUF4038)/Putative collagen-binding domain of a collagenase
MVNQRVGDRWTFVAIREGSDEKRRSDLAEGRGCGCRGHGAGVTLAVVDEGGPMKRWRQVASALLCAGALVALVACGEAKAPAAIRAAPPARAAKAPAPAYPLKVGRSRRYLVDQRNRPFLIVGDSPQALMVNLSTRQAAHFLANRRAAGFNAMWVNLLSTTYTGGRDDASTYDGIRPFRRQDDLATPNPAYFRRADAMLRIAARDRIVVFLDPIETGGFLDVLRKNGTAKAYAYGRYLGRRYRSFRNILWFNGNDFQSWRDPHDDALVLAVARGIRSVDRSHLHTVELEYKVSSSLDDGRWRGTIGLDAAYTYAPTYTEVLQEYQRRAHLPVFMVEANYEGEHDYTGPITLRRQEYWSLLSGAAGQFYGNQFTWQMAHEWQQHLDTVGSRQMTYVTNLFVRRRWWRLVPDANHRLVVDGYGEAKDCCTVDESDYVTAARTRGGRLAIAYLPAGQTITVDLSRMAGRVRARWYDPTSGRFVGVAGSPFHSSGQRSFAPPGANAEGENDWVLVLVGS